MFFITAGRHLPGIMPLVRHGENHVTTRAVAKMCRKITAAMPFIVFLPEVLNAVVVRRSDIYMPMEREATQSMSVRWSPH